MKNRECPYCKIPLEKIGLIKINEEITVGHYKCSQCGFPPRLSDRDLKTHDFKWEITQLGLDKLKTLDFSKLEQIDSKKSQEYAKKNLMDFDCAWNGKKLTQIIAPEHFLSCLMSKPLNLREICDIFREKYPFKILGWKQRFLQLRSLVKKGLAIKHTRPPFCLKCNARIKEITYWNHGLCKKCFKDEKNGRFSLTWSESENGFIIKRQ